MEPPIPGTDCPEIPQPKHTTRPLPTRVILYGDEAELVKLIPEMEARILELEAGSIQFPLRVVQDLYSLTELLEAWGIPEVKRSSIWHDRKRQPNNGKADVMHGEDRLWNLATALQGPPGWMEGQIAVRREALRLILAGRKTGTPRPEGRSA